MFLTPSGEPKFGQNSLAPFCALTNHWHPSSDAYSQRCFTYLADTIPAIAGTSQLSAYDLKALRVIALGISCPYPAPR